jgi:hypothetical protein
MLNDCQCHSGIYILPKYYWNSVEPQLDPLSTRSLLGQKKCLLLLLLLHTTHSTNRRFIFSKDFKNIWL